MNRLFLLFLAGCLCPPGLAAKQNDQTFARVENIPSGTAVVYLFKRSRYGKAIHSYTIYDELVGALLQKRTYFPLLVREGDLSIALKLNIGTEDRKCTQSWGFRCGEPLFLQVESGHEYYVMDTGGAFSTELVIPEASDVEKVLYRSKRANMPLFDGFHEYNQAGLFASLALEHDAAGDRVAALDALNRSIPHFRDAATRFSDGSRVAERHRQWRSVMNIIGPAAAVVGARLQAVQMAQATGGTGFGVVNYSGVDVKSASDAVALYAALSAEMSYFAEGISEVATCYSAGHSTILACERGSPMAPGSLETRVVKPDPWETESGG